MNWVGPPCILPKITLQNAREARHRFDGRLGTDLRLSMMNRCPIRPDSH
jgi:hypothetical protein